MAALPNRKFTNFDASGIERVWFHRRARRGRLTEFRPRRRLCAVAAGRMLGVPVGEILAMVVRGAPCDVERGSHWFSATELYAWRDPIGKELAGG